MLLSLYVQSLTLQERQTSPSVCDIIYFKRTKKVYVLIRFLTT